MITNLKLKFGRTPSSTPEQIAVTPITVFVGPNNSGKSRVLAEIEQYCRTGSSDDGALILSSLSFSGLSADRIETSINQFIQLPSPGESVTPGHVYLGSRYGRVHLNLEMLKSVVATPHTNVPAFCQWYLTHSTLILDGKSRINLVNEKPAGDLQRPPQNSLQVLFRDNEKRLEVRRMVHDAFGTYFVLDPTNIGHLRIRLSSRTPESEIEERGLHEDAVKFHAAAQLIDQASDGVKAFAGIVTEVMAGDPHVILMDEPEAFLHPALASRLGQEVSRAALTSDKRVFISTHSPAFVMGCIQSGAPVNIVRLTYRGNVATARVLPSDEILELMRHPLLRSTGVLSGLFYEFVVVTESDADRAFYQEINERLLQFKPEWGIPNCLFINAQNKQTIHTILRPLRKLGIPAVGIVDVDVLKEGGANWMQLLGGANVPEFLQNALGGMRANIKAAMTASGKDMKRDGGLRILEGQQFESAESLITQLKEYGIFVVPGGELESWLLDLDVGKHGPSWLIGIFEKMGSEPSEKTYIKPQDNDVWLFLYQIKKWLIDPQRKGIPA